MILQSPLKQGTTRTGYIHTLVSLDDLRRCITQGFGEDLSGPACNWDATKPCSQTLYQSLGLKGHNGLDIACEDGVEVYASHDGLATFQEDSAKGLGVTITADTYKSLYWHLRSSPIPLNGAVVVKKGDFIGYADSTGYSNATHLHFGLKLLDLNGQVLSRDNGFDGAVDPSPYLTWFNTMTKKEVTALQALEGYSDPEGVKFWTGKLLAGYLKARLTDKIKTLQNANT